MSSILANVIAAFVTLPLLGYLLVFFIGKKVTKSKRRANHLAIDFSTLLLIISVHHLILVIWEKSYLWVLFLVMIFVAMIFTFIHWKVKSEINFPAIIKGFWRMNFLLFFSFHILLFGIGLVKRIASLLMS